MSRNDVLERNPRPIARPSTIQSRVLSLSPLKVFRSWKSIAAVARYNAASVPKNALAAITSGERQKIKAAKAPAIRPPICFAARYTYHELRP